MATASAASTANLLEDYNEDDDGECSVTNFVIAVKPHHNGNPKGQSSGAPNHCFL